MSELPPAMGYVRSPNSSRRYSNVLPQIFTRRDEGDSLALLNTYASKVQSYCDDGDPFCSRGTDGDVHSSTVAKYAQAAANFIVSKSM